MDSLHSVEAELDSTKQTQARRYARIRRYLSLVELLLVGMLLIALLLSGLSHELTGFLALPIVPETVIYFLALVLVYFLITAPLDYYTGLALPRRYGLSHQTFLEWLGDRLKAGSLTLSLGAGLVAAGYWLMTVSVNLWWLWGWGVAIVISLVLSMLAPIILVPLFFKTKPLAGGELKERLEKLAQEAGIKIGGIYTIEFSAKGTTANAALMGAGKTRRILLSDTLLDKYTPDEISVIMAHEMGHQRHKDMLRLFSFQAVILLATFYLTSLMLQAGVRALGLTVISDAAALPLVILLLGLIGIGTAPIINAVTRYIEAQADGYALRLTNDTEAFVSAMSKLTDQNLAEGAPPRWVELLLDDHPSYRQRVAMAKRYKANKAAS